MCVCVYIYVYFLTLTTIYLDVKFVLCVDLSQVSETLGLKLNFFWI